MDFFKNLFSFRSKPAPATLSGAANAATLVNQLCWATLAGISIYKAARSDNGSKSSGEAPSLPTNKELRAACRDAGVRGYSKMNKQQLVNALSSAAGA